MGYETEFNLSFEAALEKGADEQVKQLEGLLDFKNVKPRSYADLKKVLGSATAVDAHFEAMEALQKKLVTGIKKKMEKERRNYGPNGVDAKATDDELIEGFLELIEGAIGGVTWKWYEHEEDMRLFSRLFPDIIFTMRGDGEENEDIWMRYYRDGKCQVAKAEVKFEAYDAKKLK